MFLTLNKINYFSTARHFDSYDFTTLYTSIPHAALSFGDSGAGGVQG